MSRPLSLTREHLSDLTPRDLSGVAGAAEPLPTRVCTGYYPSLNAPCATTLVPATLTTV